MDIKDFDNKLKKLAKDEGHRAPEDLKEKISATYDSLEKRGKRNIKRLMAKVAAVFIFVFMGTGVFFPTFAEKLPILGPVFQSINERFGLNEVYSEYGIEVNKEAQLGAVKLTIENVVYDGVELVVFYKVSSVEPLKDTSFHLFNLGLKARWYGEALLGGMSTGYKVDDYNYYGISKLDLDFWKSPIKVKKNPEKLNLSFYVDKIEGWDGKQNHIYTGAPLKFSIALDSTKIPKKDIEINKKVKTEYGDIIFDKLTITAGNIDIYYSTVSENNSLYFGLLLREKSLGPLDIDGGIASSQSGNKMKGYLRINLSSLEEMKNLKELVIIPVVNSTTNAKKNKTENEGKYEDILINNDSPTIIKQSEKGTLQVRKIEYKDTETLITIESTGDSIYERPGFYDSEEKWYSYYRIIDRKFEEGTFTYTMVMGKMDPNKEYYYKDYLYWDDGKILEDEKIEINLSDN